MARVLIVDDEPNMLKLIERHLRADGHAMVLASSVREGLAAIEAQDFDVVLTDQKLPDGEGLAILQSLVQSGSATAIVMLTAHGSVELAVETMRKGAFDFLTKPFNSENLRAVVERPPSIPLFAEKTYCCAVQSEHWKDAASFVEAVRA